MKKILLTGIISCFLSSAHSCPNPLTPQDLAAMKKNSGFIQDQRGARWKANEALDRISLKQLEGINIKQRVAAEHTCSYDVSSTNYKGILILKRQ